MPSSCRRGFGLHESGSGEVQWDGAATQPRESTAAPDASDTRWYQFAKLLMIAAVFGIALAGAFFRQTGVPKPDTIFAEDGSLFAACAYSHSLVDCMTSAYAGWLHALPRLAADVAVFGDPLGLSFRLTLLSGMFAGVAAVVAALAILDVTRDSMAGLLGGVGLTLVWPAAIEVTGTIGNLHWVFLAASIVVIVCSWLGRPPGVIGIFLLVMTVLSSPYAPLLLVLSLASVAARSPGARLMTMMVALAALPQMLTMATSPRRVVPYPEPNLNELLSLSGLAIREMGAFGGGQAIANIAVLTLAATFAVLLATQRRHREAVAVTTVLVGGLLILVASLYLNHALAVRYSYIPAALGVTAVALGMGLMARRAPATVGRVATLAVVITVGLGFTLTFRQHTHSSDGPDVVAQIRSADCSEASSFSVWISPLFEWPPPWSMSIPCRKP